MVAQELLEVAKKEDSNDSVDALSKDAGDNYEKEAESKNNNEGVQNGLQNEKNYYDEEVNEADISCGIFSWSPKWLQGLASKKSYILVYGMLGMSQQAISSYFIGTISTIEKRFKLPSITTGIISSAWDIGAISTALLMAYFGSSGRKTRWVASGATVAAFSCLLRYLPHFLYGPGDDLPVFTNTSLTNSTGNLCSDPNSPIANCSLNSEGMVAFIVLTLAAIALGVGTSSYYTLGAAYLDDNTLKNKFPLLLAIATVLRYLGPTLGFLTASFTLSIYVDPNKTPPYGQNDPRWIGAWYLGWIPFGILHVSLAFVMSFFPKMLPREAERRIESKTPLKQAKKTKSLNDFKETIMRLLRNPILMLNTLSSNFYLFGMIGYWIFMPKYIETQFRQTASAASLITGTIGLVCTAIGVMVSGSVVSRFRPRATYLAAWNVFTETVDIIGHAGFAFLGCYKADLFGSYTEDGSWNMTDTCNSDCSCTPRLPYSPICSEDQLTTFYSPCHAGCLDSSTINGTKMYFNCSCIPGNGIATQGACPFDCNNHFMIFLILLCFMKFLSATGRAGNTIIQFRSVAPEDKSISIALAEVFVCAFAFVPAPIAYGMLLDHSCLIWGETCGKLGNCWLYQSQTLRYLLNFTAAGFLTLATIMDVGVWYKVGSLKIYDEDMVKDKENQDEKSEPTTEPLIKNDTQDLTK